MDKKKILIISGIVNIILLLAVLINIIIVIPLTAENAWVYGLYIVVAGLVAVSYTHLTLPTILLV